MAEWKVKAFDNLRKCCGCVQNGSEMTVVIAQDDATRTFVVRVGENASYGDTLQEALAKAAEGVETGD